MSNKNAGNKKNVTSQEPTFTHEEIMAKASSFSESPELIAGALRLSGKEKLTRQQIQNAIKQFKERRV